MTSLLRVSSDNLQCYTVFAYLVLSELKVLSLAESIQKEKPFLCSPCNFRALGRRDRGMKATPELPTFSAREILRIKF